MTSRHVVCRMLTALAVATATALVCPPAAATVASQLDYFRDSDAANCPTEPKLREAVAARLGYDPFIEWSPRRVVIDITSDRARLTAILRVIGGGGVVASRSELSADHGDCEELIAAVALAIAIHLDPNTAMTETRNEQPVPEATGVTEAHKVETRVPSPRVAAPSGLKATPRATRVRDVTPLSARDELRLIPALRLGPAYLRGIEPHSTLALRAGASLRYGSLHALIELIAGLPDDARYAVGGVRSNTLGVTFLPCVSYRWIAGCAAAMLDRTAARGVNVPVSVTAVLPQFAIGGRLEATWQLNHRWAVVTGIDLLRNLTFTALRLQRAEVWQSSKVRYSLGFAVEMRFP